MKEDISFLYMEGRFELQHASEYDGVDIYGNCLQHFPSTTHLLHSHMHSLNDKAQLQRTNTVLC
jgi:hypothetical protein